MPKRNKRHRRRALPVNRSGNLFVIAGIPGGISQEIVSWLEGAFSKNDKFIVQAASRNDYRVYGASYVDLLIEAVSKNTIKRRRSPSSDPTPAGLFLLFVPTPDHADLLDRFDFCAYPFALTGLAERNETGTMRRHSFDGTKAELERLLRGNPSSRMGFNTLKERISRQCNDEELLLPPRNFVIEEETEESERRILASDFKKYRNGECSWSDRMSNLELVRVDHEEIAHLAYGRKLNLYRDARGLYFRLSEPNEHHGAVREMEADASVRDLLLMMKSLYRFGAPLPSGLHHDIQFRRGVTINGVKFNCARDDTVSRSGTHVPVYPNDVVR